MTDIATRLYLAALETGYDTTAGGWLQIVDRAGLKLVDKSEGADSIDDILAQGWTAAAHGVNAEALNEVRRRIRGES